MKKVSIASLIVLLIVVAGCKKEGSVEQPTAKAKDKLLGTWKLQRTEEETWHPVNVLVDTDVIPGEPGDSAIFSNTIAKGYSDVNGHAEEEILDLTWLNDSTITLDDERYVIRKLTDTELYLYQEEVNTADDAKDVYKVFMVR